MSLFPCTCVYMFQTRICHEYEWLENKTGCSIFKSRVNSVFLPCHFQLHIPMSTNALYNTVLCHIFSPLNKTSLSTRQNVLIVCFSVRASVCMCGRACACVCVLIGCLVGRSIDRLIDCLFHFITLPLELNIYCHMETDTPWLQGKGSVYIPHNYDLKSLQPHRKADTHWSKYACINNRCFRHVHTCKLCYFYACHY